MLFLVLLIVLVFFGFRVTTPEERQRLFARTLAIVRPMLMRVRERSPEWDAFCDQLRARTPWALMTPTLVLLNVAIFVLMHAGAGMEDGPATYLGWGGSFGPRTTNGEWWRLLTSIFVHTNMPHLLVSIMGLVTVGRVLERYVGSVTFLAVYLTSGVVAGLVNLRWQPVALTGGASGSIFALYGLLLACCVWSLPTYWPRLLDLEENRAREVAAHVAMPFVAVKHLIPSASVFFLYSLFGDGLARPAELTAVSLGLASGVFMLRRIGAQKPAARRMALVTAAASVIAVAAAVPVRAITDVRPDMEQIVALEERTAGAYQAAYERFKRGRTTSDALAQVIEQIILPDLIAADEALKALERVPLEHRPLVVDAGHYVRLRSESWRLRADGLRSAGTLPAAEQALNDPSSTAAWRVQAETKFRTNIVTLGKAEAAERSALEALKRIMP